MGFSGKNYEPGSNVDKFWKKFNSGGSFGKRFGLNPVLTASEWNALEIAKIKDQGAFAPAQTSVPAPAPQVNIPEQRGVFGSQQTPAGAAGTSGLNGQSGGFQPAGSPVQTSGNSNGSISSALTAAATYKPVSYEATPYTAFTPSVTANELTSNQLNKLLSSDNPYIKRARLKGTEYANSRGLLNSTMGAQAAEAAAIDAAVPIAQSDANAYFQRAIQNAQAQNAANQFNANAQNVAAAHNADQQTAANEFRARANTDAVMNAIADAQKRGQTRLEASLNSAQEGTKQTAGLYAQYLQAASEINKADMDLKDKQAQINALRSAMIEGVNTTSNMYKSDFGNVDLEGSVPGEGTYIKNLYSAIDAALA